jgi:SpoVK/Ycf46/Vps4 family AAA+-type ATPase
LELWIVDLARIVDKYLGETEKQLDRVLRAAESAGAMLLFDEADALFGRRGDVRDARDRWANVEVAYLLQRIEDHDGVTVLTTNLSQNIDDAFARRMSQRVEFAVPDAGLRRQLWRMSVPATAPVDDGALLTVADRFELAGGAIRTAALNAAYAAATQGGSIELGHLVRASVQELTKAGRAPTRDELAELAPLAGSGRGAR